jgi:hypothetical protein
MSLSRIDESLLLAAWFRGGEPGGNDGGAANTDQVLALSLFYTGDISGEECTRWFSQRGYVRELFELPFESLTTVATARDQALIELLKARSDLIVGHGDWKTPCFPTFRACGLTAAGAELAPILIDRFPAKPDFPNWPDKRPSP